MTKKAPDYCPQCGAPLKPTASACPECGSDWHTGWSSGAEVDWETPDYDELLEKEFGEKPPARPRHKAKMLFIGVLAFFLALLLVGVL
jgi:hypothetical protein